MQKSFDVRFPLESDYEKLKTLWKTSFDDSEESLDFFFKNTVSPHRVLAAFDGEIPVSALYMLESEIVIDEKIYSSYYIYAVCTHPDYRKKGLMNKLFEKLFSVSESRGIDYLFLVPEEEYLFEVYGKLSFENGFCYSEKVVLKDSLKDAVSQKTEKTDFQKYREYRLKTVGEFPTAVLKESTFKSFFNSSNGEVKSFFVNGVGYVLFEETKEKTTVYELCGDEKILLKAVFDNTDKDTLIYRYPSFENSVPYGMYYKFGNVPEIKKGFFGIPYST